MNEHDMKDFKAAYDAIPVPKELEGRVRASLQAAKQEQRRNKARKRRLLWQRTGAGAAAAMAAVVLLANSSPVVARAMEQVPVVETPSLEDVLQADQAAREAVWHSAV